MLELMTRNDAKVREMTCGYAEDVDGINAFGSTAHHALRDPSASGCLQRWH